MFKQFGPNADNSLEALDRRQREYWEFSQKLREFSKSDKNSESKPPPLPLSDVHGYFNWLTNHSLACHEGARGKGEEEQGQGDTATEEGGQGQNGGD